MARFLNNHATSSDSAVQKMISVIGWYLVLCIDIDKDPIIQNGAAEGDVRILKKA